MENFGIKKFEKFDHKKYMKENNLRQISKAKLPSKEKKDEIFKLKESLSNEKWDHLHTEESFHPNSAQDDIDQFAESIRDSIKPKSKNLIHLFTVIRNKNPRK